jgi:hypothetical protein
MGLIKSFAISDSGAPDNLGKKVKMLSLTVSDIVLNSGFRVRRLSSFSSHSVKSWAISQGQNWHPVGLIRSRKVKLAINSRLLCFKGKRLAQHILRIIFGWKASECK